MNVAVIGTGYWGKKHVRVFKELLTEGEIGNLTICDTNEKRAKELSKTFGIEYVTNYSELLTSDIEAVTIATPSDTHYRITKEFLEAGKHCLVEKPMTTSSEDAEKLIKTAEKEDRILMVGHIFRHHSGVKELKKRIDRGDLGKIYYLSSNRLSLRLPRKDMGVLFALAIHEVDLFCYLLGKEHPRKLMATTESYLGGVEETAMLTLFFDEGVKGYAFESWLTPIYVKERDLMVVGSRMSAKLDYLKPQEIQIFDATISSETVRSEGSYMVPIEYKEPLKEELRHFIHCVKTGEKPLSDMYAGKRAVEMIEKAISSAKEGKIINL